MLATECGPAVTLKYSVGYALSLSIIHDHSDVATRSNIAAIAQVPARGLKPSSAAATSAARSGGANIGDEAINVGAQYCCLAAQLLRREQHLVGCGSGLVS